MHVYNEQKKRLEPTETKCQYCNMAHSTHMDHNYFIPLYREQDRTNIHIYRSVKYQRIPVGVPRCESCMAIHEKAATNGSVTAWALAIVLVMFCFRVDSNAGMVSIIVGVLIIQVGTDYFSDKLTMNEDLPTTREGALQNEAVKELLQNGWSLKKPRA